MDATRVALLREVLAGTEWIERTGVFGRALSSSARTPGRLLLVGTPQEEPWHLAAHLDDESRWHGMPSLAPTLVRWSPPTGVAPHLRVGMDRLEGARRGETVFVVAPASPPASLLERASDARRSGATVLSLHSDDRDLGTIAHEALTVPPGEETVSFEAVQHLVSSAASDPGTRRRKDGFRGRLARLLDTVSGPAAS